MWLFGEEELLLLHHKLIERFGGSHGVRDLSRLNPALTAPKTSYYSTLFDKAAVYSRNIIGYHPFVDSNKRTGIMAAVIFLEKNDVELKLQKNELEDFAVKIVTDDVSINEIADWLNTKAV